MATTTQIAELRVMINEPTPGVGSTSIYTDLYLTGRIDGWKGSLQALAGAIWREKAGTYAGLVDVQEGSSRRSLGSLHANALKMASGFDAASAEVITSARASRTREIERP